ncbi:MAG: hypothetical protein IKE22_09565, partial [Atopobiaceae bacterium]|nr:hypothetical protein [Atopobiaceae bacterium]
MFNKPTAEIEAAQLAFVRGVHSDWALVTAGTEDAWNTMTIGWGTIGTVWGKPILMVMVRPQRYTYGLINAAGEF